MVISLKESQDKIFLQIIVKSFLPYCTLHNILWEHFIDKLMTNLIPSTEKLDFHIQLVLKHVMRSIKVILELLDIGDFEAEIAGEVVGSEFEGNFLDEFLFVYFDSNFKVQFIDQFVGDVLFGGPVVEKLDKVFLILDCHFFPGLNEVLLEQKLDSLKVFDLLAVLESVPTILPIFSHQVKSPTFTHN
jgi:hypothetical protein